MLLLLLHVSLVQCQVLLKFRSRLQHTHTGHNVFHFLLPNPLRCESQLSTLWQQAVDVSAISIRLCCLAMVVLSALLRFRGSSSSPPHPVHSSTPRPATRLECSLQPRPCTANFLPSLKKQIVRQLVLMKPSHKA